MDIGYSKLQIAAKNNDEERFIAFNRAAGSRGSANEHAVPEQLFSTPDNQVEAVSAVKAIAVAAAQGQRIYTITQDNLAAALEDLTLGKAIEGDIRNAVHAGLKVSAHRNPISYAGFNGAGYIISDPETGSGAFKISGSANGGALDFLGITVSVVSYLTSLKADLLLTDSPDFAKLVQEKFLNFLSVAGVTIDLVKVATKCKGQSEVATAVLGIASITLGLLALAARLTGIVGIIISYLLELVADLFFKDWLIDYICEPEIASAYSQQRWSYRYS